MIQRHLVWLVVVIATSQIVLLNDFVVAQQQLTSEQRALAREFSRGRKGDSAAARAALQSVIKLEMERLRSPLSDKQFDVERYDDIRVSIYNTYLRGTRQEHVPAHKVAVGQIVKSAQEMLLDKTLSPQTHINALALLAELDDQPLISGSVPQPARGALMILYGVANDEATPVYLRAIALHGMHRQISVWWSSWNAQARNAVGQMLLKIANSEPKSAVDLKSHAWLVRRAYDCLSATGSTAGAPLAIERLADPKALPSLRLSAATYLSKTDASKLDAEQKALYLVGLAHFIRSQLVSWYESEDDKLQAKSGALGGYGYGGFGSGYGEDGGEGEGYGGMDAAYGMDGGYGGYGDFGDSGGAGTQKPKPKDTQTWQTRVARRLLNQVTQAAHIALDGKPLSSEKKVAVGVKKPLVEAELTAEGQAKVQELIEAVDSFQTIINDPGTITDINSLLNQAQTPIEDIMDLVLEIPGFQQRYPDLADDEALETVPEVPQAPPTGGEKPADGNADGSAEEAAGEGTPPNAGDETAGGQNGN